MASGNTKLFFHSSGGQKCKYRFTALKSRCGQGGFHLVALKRESCSCFVRLPVATCVPGLVCPPPASKHPYPHLCPLLAFSSNPDCSRVSLSRIVVMTLDPREFNVISPSQNHERTPICRVPFPNKVTFTGSRK